jgi:hypothetical protein
VVYGTCGWELKTGSCQVSGKRSFGGKEVQVISGDQANPGRGQSATKEEGMDGMA